MDARSTSELSWRVHSFLCFNFRRTALSARGSCWVRGHRSPFAIALLLLRGCTVSTSSVVLQSLMVASANWLSGERSTYLPIILALHKSSWLLQLLRRLTWDTHLKPHLWSWEADISAGRGKKRVWFGDEPQPFMLDWYWLSKLKLGHENST